MLWPLLDLRWLWLEAYSALTTSLSIWRNGFCTLLAFPIFDRLYLILGKVLLRKWRDIVITLVFRDVNNVVQVLQYLSQLLLIFPDRRWSTRSLCCFFIFDGFLDLICDIFVALGDSHEVFVTLFGLVEFVELLVVKQVSSEVILQLAKASIVLFRWYIDCFRYAFNAYIILVVFACVICVQAQRQCCSISSSWQALAKACCWNKGTRGCFAFLRARNTCVSLVHVFALGVRC